MAVDYAALKKGGFMRQKQKNNFSLRLQVVGGNLTAENLKKIAEVAEKYGDGHVHLTSRQSVEIPFVKLDDVEEVKEELAKGGCKPGVCGQRVRQMHGRARADISYPSVVCSEIRSARENPSFRLSHRRNSYSV